MGTIPQILKVAIFHDGNAKWRPPDFGPPPSVEPSPVDSPIYYQQLKSH